MTATLDFLPPPDFQVETIEDFMVTGHIITAVPRSTRSRGRGRAARHRELSGSRLPPAPWLGSLRLIGTPPDHLMLRVVACPLDRRRGR